uniref:Frizzled-4 n=1 Tax=Macrostomum lignano TaxID=282301 RepID=A0A1I8HRV7_9PLAT
MRLQILLALLLPSQLVCATAGLHKCEPIRVDLCQGIGYNLTTKAMNLAGHADQRDAEVMLTTFSPLIQYQCSRSLRFFLCSVLTPMCDPKWPKPIGPCRPLCERVRTSCYPVLSEFGFDWPAFLNCSNFPESNDRGDHMCMEGSPGGDSVGEAAPPQQPQAPRKTPENFWAALDEWRRTVASRAFRPGCEHMRNSGQYLFLNHTGECALLCHGQDLFTLEDRRLAELWSGILAGICALSSLVTVLTFLIDRRRFRYPVRPVLFMSACYLCYSAAFFIRLLAGREAAACDRDPATGRLVLIRHGLDNTNCAVVFLLQYFFSTAANAWYVILVFTWLLQAGWKWSPEAVARRSCYFHLPAWLLPVALTVCILIVRRVEADELLGMCGVGGQTSGDTLLLFVALPQVAFLALAVVCLAAGFVAMSRVRRQARSDGRKTGRFDVLMGKIGLFSALYVAPTACLAGLNLYELSQRDLWHVPGSPYRPSAAVFLIRVFASLAIGLTTVLWIVGGKTLRSWRRFFTPGGSRGRGRRHDDDEDEDDERSTPSGGRLHCKQPAGGQLPLQHHLPHHHQLLQQQQQQQFLLTSSPQISNNATLSWSKQPVPGGNGGTATVSMATPATARYGYRAPDSACL